MNGLSLRIVRGGMKKSKNLIGFPPVHIETSFFSETGMYVNTYEKFMKNVFVSE